jgi:hypothetical protein
MEEAVHAWLVTQRTTFFSEGIQKRVDHWTKCVEKDGAYTEQYVIVHTHFNYYLINLIADAF